MKFILFCVFATLATSLRMLPGSASSSLTQEGVNLNSDMRDRSTAALTMRDVKDWEAKPKYVKSNGTGSIAVFIAGLQDKLLLKSKLDNVIVPLFEQGYTVDVFTHLIASGHQEGGGWLPPVKNSVSSFPETNVADLCGLLQRKIKDVANLAYCKLQKEVVNVDAHREVLDQKQLPRFRMYDGDIKHNTMRRLYALEHLMKTSALRGEYDYYLMTKDDEHWFAPLDLSAFPDKDPNKVYHKDCKDFYGVNDKTFLFGREAAKKGLLNLYADFVMEDPRLDTLNVETYWKAYFDLKGIKEMGVPFNVLQTSDAAYQQKDSSMVMCIKELYLCDPGIISSKTPQLCEETEEGQKMIEEVKR